MIRPETNRYSIMYCEHPGHWIATPESDEKKAMQWARRNKERIIAHAKPGMLFKIVAKDFFSPQGKWAARMARKGRKFNAVYFQHRQAYVDNFLIPALGDLPLDSINRRIIDDAILGASSVLGKSNKPLAPATKNKVLHTAKIMFGDFVDSGFINANPVEGIARYDCAPVTPRGAIPIVALKAMFPENHDNLVSVWGGLVWAALFCYLADTGNRPGEARALLWKEINFHERFVVIRHAIAAGTVNTIKGTKTNTVKPAYLSERTVSVLSEWRLESSFSADDDFIFADKHGNPYSNDNVNKAFHRRMVDLGYGSEPWTPYWLRHSFGTYQLKNLTVPELMSLMGHATMLTSKVYQHPDDEIIYEQSKGLRDKLHNHKPTE